MNQQQASRLVAETFRQLAERAEAGEIVGAMYVALSPAAYVSTGAVGEMPPDKAIFALELTKQSVLASFTEQRKPRIEYPSPEELAALQEKRARQWKGPR
jgi:hypothetical protein